MKKFTYSLQTVFNYIRTVEKTQKADLSQAWALLRQLLDEDRELDVAYEKNRLSLEAALKRGIGLSEELSKHDAYFRYLRDTKAALLIKIKAAEIERDKCQERLISTMKQIKVYAKLRDEQYSKYMQEAKIEEEKDMGDLVSFNIISEGSDLS